MRATTTGPHKSLHKALSVIAGLLIVLSLGLSARFSPVRTSFAQGEPSAQPSQTVLPTRPTNTPFANVLTQIANPKSSSSPTASTTPPVDSSTETRAAPAVATLDAESAAATITALQSENQDLRDKLASTSTDEGATLYALVIVVIGLLLAFAVFFGLKRS